MLKRCQYVYRKDHPIEYVYYVIQGEVLKIEEHCLDLKRVLNVKYKKNDIVSLIAQLLRRLLIKALPEIYANNALKRFTALGRQKLYMDDIETDDNFLHSNKRKVEINEKLCVMMKKVTETILKGEVFGDEDIMNHKARYQISTIAKESCWILRVKQNLFKTGMKENTRRVKEAKAVFIFYSLPNKNKAFGYMKFKDFFMKNFTQHRVKMHSEVIKQGEVSDKVSINT